MVAVFAGVMNAVAQFILPLVIIIILYIHMFMVLRRKSKVRGVEPSITRGEQGTSKGHDAKAKHVGRDVAQNKGIDSDDNESEGGRKDNENDSTGQIYTIEGQNLSEDEPANAEKHQKSNQLVSAQRNIIKTLLVITIIFAFCWIWNQIYFLLYLGGKVVLTHILYHITIYIVFLNCCVNPFVYALQYKEFQKQMKKLLGVKFGRVQSEVSRTDTQTGSNTCTHTTH